VCAKEGTTKGIEMLNPLVFDGLQRLIGSSKVSLMRFLPLACYSIDNLAELACLGAVAEGPIVPATAADERCLCSRNKSVVPPVMNPALYAGQLAPFAPGVCVRVQRVVVPRKLASIGAKSE